MTNQQVKSCDTCNFGHRYYSDGYVYKDWSGCFTGDPATLPKEPDPAVFWTYVTCDKNAKKLQHVNLTGNCSAFSNRKK